jgi:excisionase family DNA binding protein
VPPLNVLRLDSRVYLFPFSGMVTQKSASSPVGALKLKEAAKYLSLSLISVRRLIQRGLIKPNRALRHILIPIAELDRFLKQGGRREEIEIGVSPHF